VPAITEKDTRLKLQFVANTDHSIHAGLVAVEARARRFDLWRKLRQFACLDPRKDKRRGYGPEVIIGQLLYALGSGGGCLSHSEALNDDPLARELFGVGKFADQSQVGEWLRERSEESVADGRSGPPPAGCGQRLTPPPTEPSPSPIRPARGRAWRSVV